MPITPYLTSIDLPLLKAPLHNIWVKRLSVRLITYGYLPGVFGDQEPEIFDHVPQCGQFVVGSLNGVDIWQHYVQRTLVRQGNTVEDLEKYLIEIRGEMEVGNV